MKISKPEVLKNCIQLFNWSKNTPLRADALFLREPYDPPGKQLSVWTTVIGDRGL